MKHSSGMSSAWPLFARSLHRLKMFGPKHFVWLIDGPVFPFAVFALFFPLLLFHSSSVCGVMSVSVGFTFVSFCFMCLKACLMCSGIVFSMLALSSSDPFCAISLAASPSLSILVSTWFCCTLPCSSSHQCSLPIPSSSSVVVAMNSLISSGSVSMCVPSSS